MDQSHWGNNGPTELVVFSLQPIHFFQGEFTPFRGAKSINSATYSIHIREYHISVTVSDFT